MSSSLLPDGRVPVLLSAHDNDLLADDAAAIGDYVDRERCDVAQVAAQLVATRRVRRHRAVVRATDTDELAAGLRAISEGAEHPLVERSARRATTRTAFVFPGQGSQWQGMGAEAYSLIPGYRGEADRLNAAFLVAGLSSPLAFLTTDSGPDAVSQLELQGAQFIHSVALAALWRACGIVPDLAIGHSLGEVAAAYVAEVITLDDAVAVLAARAHAIESIRGSHGVAVLGVDHARATELISETPGWLEISAVNAAESVAVAGERDAIAAVVAAANARGLFARQLAMSFPAHTSAMESQREELLRRLPRSVFAESAVQFIGSATGAVVPAGTEFGNYWYANLRNVIRFDQAAQTAIGCGAGMFVEMSMQTALQLGIEDVMEGTAELDHEPAVLIGSCRGDASLADRLAANITAAAVADPAYRWADLLGTRPEPLRGFPGAPMRTEHLWATTAPLPPAPGLIVTAETWQPQPPHGRPAGGIRSVAVLDLGGDGALTGALRDAVESHCGAVLTAVPDAEVVLAVESSLAQTDITTAVTDLSARIDAGLLDYVETLGALCRDVWLVTVGAERVEAGDPVADPAQAGLAAIHRCLGFEFADLDFHHVDLPSPVHGGGAASPAELVDVVLHRAGEIAIRGDRTAAVVYRRALGDDAPAAPPWPLQAGVLDNVVITGGSGTIGLSFARSLVAAGAARIVLLSRRGVSPSVLDQLTLGRDVEIVAPACDITDVEQLSATVAENAAGEATLVIHAAGTASFADRKDITGRSLLQMSAAKLGGLHHLMQVWPIRDEARIMLCSSVTGVWGGKGVAAYAAANRILDVMAGRLRADGRNCVAVRWGLWEGSGIVDAAEIARVQRTGLRQMRPDLAVEAGLRDYPDDPVVLAADPERLQVFFGSSATGQSNVSVGLPAVPEEAMAPPEAVRSQLAGVLNVEAATLDLDASLFDLGVDSLLAVDLRKRLKRLTGRTVPLATLLGGITGTDLIAGFQPDLQPDLQADFQEKVETSRD